MKLGEMLVRDGRITQSQLEQALAHQTRVGGRIGSILVELGFMDAETLTVYALPTAEQHPVTGRHPPSIPAGSRAVTPSAGRRFHADDGVSARRRAVGGLG